MRTLRPIKAVLSTAVTLTLLSVFITVAPASANVADGFEYNIVDGKAVIIACENYQCPESLVIPVQVGGLDVIEVRGDFQGGIRGAKTLTFANGSKVTSIGDQAFAFTQLTSVVFPPTLTSIGGGAFEGCELESVTLNEGLLSIGGSAFHRAKFTTIEIPNSLTTLGTAWTDSQTLTSITVKPLNTNFKVVNGFLLSKDGTQLITSPAGRTDVTAHVPNGVTHVWWQAFTYTNIQYLTFPASTVDFDAFIFYESSTLKGIVFNAINVNLHVNMFYGCGNIEWLLFKGHKPTLIDGSGVFNGAPDMTIFYDASVATGDEWSGIFTPPDFGIPNFFVRPWVQTTTYAPGLSADSKARITGTAKVGRVVTANTGSWSGSVPPTFTYKWYSCTKPAKATTIFTTDSLYVCKVIKKATKMTLKITKTLKSKYLRVQITAEGINSASVLTKSSGKVV